MRVGIQKKLEETPKFNGAFYSPGVLGDFIRSELIMRRTVRFPIDENLAEATRDYFDEHAILRYHLGEDYEVSVETEISAPDPESTRINKTHYIIVRRKL